MPLHTSLSDCVINTLLSSPCIKPLQILFLFSTMQVLHLLRDLKSPFTLQMSLCLCGVKVYYLQSYKFIPNAFHRKQNSKQNLSIMALKFKITQACGKIIYNVMVSCSHKASESLLVANSTYTFQNKYNF